MTYALDTNTVSFLIKGEHTVVKNFREKIIEKENNYTIPYIVFYEVMRWLDYRPSVALKLLSKQFHVLFDTVEKGAAMPDSAWKKASDIYVGLRQSGQLIGDADILIAAYCIVNGFTLVTDNAKDFCRISGLAFVNWR